MPDRKVELVDVNEELSLLLGRCDIGSEPLTGARAKRRTSRQPPVSSDVLVNVAPIQEAPTRKEYRANGEGYTQKGTRPRKVCVVEECSSPARGERVHAGKCLRHSGAKPFVCEFEGCEYRAALLQHLREHRLTHTGEKPYACDYNGCKYRCTTQSHLKTHMLTHTGEKPYMCDFEGCDYRCTTQGDLKKHMRTHTGEKPYMCKFEGCDYRAGAPYNLKRHMLTHTGEKPYMCKFEGCKYRCATQSQLKRHTLTHTGEKPHMCKFEGCDYRCTEQGDLKKHMRTHTGEKPYMCKFEGCDYRCTSQSNLTTHHSRNHTKAGQARQKRQEQRVYRALIKAGFIECTQLGDAAPPPNYFVREKCIDFQCVGDVDNQRAFIDFVLNPGENKPLVFLEVDEGQHRYGYGEASCDMKRMAKVMESLAMSGFEGGVCWLRYNPDSFQIDGVTQDARKNPVYTKTNREEWLVNRLHAIEPLPDGTAMAVEYAFYDVDTRVSTTQPLVVHGDAGFHGAVVECARIAPRSLLE